MNATVTPPPLNSFRVWLATGLALLGGWVAVPLGVRAVQIFMDGLSSILDLSDPAHSVCTSLLSAAIVAAAVEGCKAASLVWPLRRRWDSWVPLGTAFGVVTAAAFLIGWVLDKGRFGSLAAPFSPWLLVITAKLVILHWALGRLAAGAARPPGGPWLAFFLAAVASTAMTLLPLQPLAFLVRVPEAVFEAEPWIRVAVLVAFALAVWRWIPGPEACATTGPARSITVVLIGLVFMTGLAVAALAAIFGPRGRSDPVPVLVFVLGVTFVAWMFYRQGLRGWIRRPD